VAAAYGETIAGVNTVAAGLRAADGHVAATLSVTGPSTRWDRAAIDRWAPVLLETASTVSALLGFRADPLRRTRPR
jgi:DNA-binding IclR family transcriptional regulator